ncbi:MAG: tetratricopeptide repeat protein [Verrucomicrobiaceae bacterium]|nr:tetratricopeptide repeat protein [Verrucomicrobiaceae bacterium]
MKRSAFCRPTLTALAVAMTFLTVQPPAWALLDFIFGKKEKVAPAANERAVQEQAASQLLAEGRAAQNAGRSGRANDYYEQILKRYPFTQSAAEAAFSRALIIRHTENDLEEAFDAFQQFIDTYRQSPRFSEAVAMQYEIAEEAKGGKRQRTLILVPMKMGSEDVISFYTQIIKNAPFGKYAPLAQFSIAEVYQDQREKDKSIEAYQKVVDNYPSTSQAAEAQFRIGSISNVAAQRSEDASNLTATRDALTTYMAANPGGERKQEVEQILRQVNTAEANQSLTVAKFYKRSGKTVAAAMYLNEALKFGSPEVSAEARQLLAELAAQDPKGVAESRRAMPGNDFTKLASRDLKSSSGYVGPLPPDLQRLGQRPKMRSGNDSFMPIPLTEPDLPAMPGGTAPTPGSLLPTLPDSEKPALLPVPAAPGSSVTPPAGISAPATPPPSVPALPAPSLPVPPKPPGS